MFLNLTRVKVNKKGEITEFPICVNTYYIIEIKQATDGMAASLVLQFPGGIKTYNVKEYYRDLEILLGNSSCRVDRLLREAEEEALEHD